MTRLAIGLLAVAWILIGAACDSTHHTTLRATQTVAPGTLDPAVPSRDGARIAVVRHVGSVGYLEVGPAREGARRRVIFHGRGCCTGVTRASRSLIAFDEGGSDEVETVDVSTHRVRRLAGALYFHVSPDGRWIAWWRTDGPESPDTIGVVPIAGGKCLLVRRPWNRQDTLPYFDPAGTHVHFLRQPFGDRQHAKDRIMSVPLSSLRRAPLRACFW